MNEPRKGAPAEPQAQILTAAEQVAHASTISDDRAGSVPAEERERRSETGNNKRLDDVEETPADPLELTVVPREYYQRGEEIGRGGMGRIVRAHDRRLGRAVAIKELLDERMDARFEREARLTARLQHPAIVSVHEAGRWPSGEPFYAMKLVAGKPLNTLIRERSALSDRLALLPGFISVVEAIAYAHSQRVLHRDIKPHNIVIGSFGETVVIDWGIAKDLSASGVDVDASPRETGDDGALTALGTVVGTPAYMSPEQARGEALDERADVFALGATLYHLLAGRPPPRTPAGPSGAWPDHDSISDTLVRAEPRVPRALAAIVATAMADNPDARYASASSLADELKRFQNGQLVAAYRYSIAERLWGFVRRNRAIVTLGVASAALVAVLGSVSLSQHLASQRRAELQIGELLLERGRQELARGAPSRALPYLVAAADRGMEDPSLPALVATAAKPLSKLISGISLAGEPITRARISPDGTRIVTAGYELDARLWALPDGRFVATLRGDPAGLLDQFEFSASGDLLVTGATCTSSRDLACDEDLRVWDAHTGVLRTVLPQESHVEHLRFTSPGVLLTSTDTSVEAWDVATGARLNSVRSWRGIPVSTDGGRSLSVIGLRDRSTDVSPDATKLLELLPDGLSIEIRRLPDKELLRTLAARERLSGALFTADGEGLLTLSHSGAVRLWDAASGVELGVWDGHAAEVLDAHLTPNGQLVTIAADNRVLTWSATIGRLSQLALESQSNQLHFGPHDRLLVVEESRLSVYEPTGAVLATQESRAPRITTRLRGPWTAASFDDSGDHVFLGGVAGELVDWHLGRNSLTMASPQVVTSQIVRALADQRFLDDEGRLLDGNGITLVAFAGWLAFHDEDSLATLSRDHDDPRVTVWNLDGRMESAVRVREPVTQPTVALSSDHQTVAAITSSGVKLLDTRTGQLRGVLTTDGRVDRVSFAPSPGRLLTVARGADVTVWRLNGREPVTLPVKVGPSMALAWSPDGQRLLVGGSDGITRVFTGDGISVLLALGAEKVPIDRVAWSRNGDIAAVSAGSRVTVWDVSLPSGSTSDAHALLARGPFELRDAVLASRTERPGVEPDRLARARRYYKIAMERLAASDHEAAARHCELAYAMEDWPGFLFCAAASYGLAGKIEVSAALLTKYERQTRVARPVSPSTEAMRARFERGQDFYEQRMFKDAITEFEAAFEIKPAASLIYNIAVCHEKLRDFKAAAMMFRRYLELSSNARDKASVELRIASLEAEAARPAPSPGDGSR